MNRTYDPQSRPPTRLAFHASRIVIDGGVLLVLGSMSLPFVTAEGFRHHALAGDGLPALLLVLPILIMTLLPDHAAPLPAPLGWASLALAGVALPYTVVKYLDASTLAGTMQGSVGMGVRVLVMGAFVVLGGVVIGLIRSLLQLPEPTAGTGAGGAASSPMPGRESAASGLTARLLSLSRRRVAAPQTAAPHDPPAPAPRAERAPARVPPVPLPGDPDTEPTVPAQPPVRPWWPDDLEDLFS